MPIKIDPSRTDAYIGTFDLRDEKDIQELENLRAMVKKINKMLQDSRWNHEFYVKLQGRLGKNNPNAWKYRRMRHTKDLPRSVLIQVIEDARKSGWIGTHQAIRISDADHVDAYIYRRKQ